MKCGGTMKMAKGGATEIVGMPKYGNNPRTQTGAMLEKGGSVKKPLVKAEFGRTVVKSDSKNYKTITKGDETKVKRTVKGVLTRALSTKKTEDNRTEYTKNAQNANLKAAQRIAGSYVQESGGGNLKGAKDIYNDVKNQKITIPKTSQYGDYKMGGAKKTLAKAKFGAAVKVQPGKVGKIRSASDQGYTAIGKREPARIVKKIFSKKK